MKESIYTIPISEVFEPRQGCPICALRAALERRWVEYITGAAMMEPDVREETNAHGFCGRHFAAMLAQRNRLAVALMLQSHMELLIARGEKPAPAGLFAKSQPEETESCFLCARVDKELARILENIAVVWARDGDFQKMYIQQEFICRPDSRRLVAAAEKKLRGQNLKEFTKTTKKLAFDRLALLKGDIDAFCRLYDYRSVGGEAPSPGVATAIERSIAFLTPD